MTDRSRIDAVLRVRRVQELQAAGELASARNELQAAEHALDAARDHYAERRGLDLRGGMVPDVRADRQTRELHARRIQMARISVRQLVDRVEERRVALTERTRAVKGLERLDERLAEQERVEELRAEVKEADDRPRIPAVTR